MDVDEAAADTVADADADAAVAVCFCSAAAADKAELTVMNWSYHCWNERQ